MFFKKEELAIHITDEELRLYCLGEKFEHFNIPIRISKHLRRCKECGDKEPCITDEELNSYCNDNISGLLQYRIEQHLGRCKICHDKEYKYSSNRLIQHTQIASSQMFSPAMVAIAKASAENFARFADAELCKLEEQNDDTYLDEKSKNWYLDEPDLLSFDEEIKSDSMQCQNFQKNITLLIAQNKYPNPDELKHWGSPWRFIKEHYQFCNICRQWTKENYPQLLGWEECGSLVGLPEDCEEFRYKRYLYSTYPKFASQPEIYGIKGAYGRD